MKKISFITLSVLSIVVLLIGFGCAPSQERVQKPVIKGKIVAAPEKLMVPPLAFDDSSITVIWSKPSDYSNVVSYKVYQNGSLAGTTTNLFFNITELEPSTPYSIIVKAVDAGGVESQPSNKIIQYTAAEIKIFDVAKYGAIGDGNTLNTKAIQKAIDECTAGGKVLIPAGTFLSGALFLKSDMTLQIDGTLLGSDDANNYPLTSMRFPYYLSGKNYMGLINAYTEKYGSLSNIKICGKGNVCGGKWEGGKTVDTVLGINERTASKNDSARGDMVVVKGVTNFYIGGLTLTNPAMHTIFISYSKNITVNGINVSTYDIHNADGINICVSDTAYVFDSTFDTGDDCINLNAGVGEAGVKENRPDNNLRIFNCTTKRGHGGVVFGSWTGAWIQNVLIEDCVFDGTDIGLRFKTGAKQGGGARNVLARDITIKNIAKNSAIFFDSLYSCDYPSGGPGQFKDIVVKNVTCTNLKKYGIYVNGLPDAPHTNLSLSNISIDGGQKGGAFINNCTNSTFDTVTITNSQPVWAIDPNTTSGLKFKKCNPAP